MALFTKIFPRLRAISHNRINEDTTVSENCCAFDANQVRMVLFRECDFRGRKLLFDSDATRKVPLEKKGEDENFVEISNGFGYLDLKLKNFGKQVKREPSLSKGQKGDRERSISGIQTKFRLSSAVGDDFWFGGNELPRYILQDSQPFRTIPTYVHSGSVRFIQMKKHKQFPAVFPSPHLSRRRISSSSQHSHLSTRSFDQSLRRADSSESSAYSSGQHLSDRSTRSTASDTVLVWKNGHYSSPPDLPRSAGILSKNSLKVDSGFGDNHSSFSSVSTGPLRFETWESIVSYKGVSFASLKHLIRSSSKSLHSSSGSLLNSTDDVACRLHHRSSKLGLAVVVQIPQDRHEFFVQFLMEHIALLESMLWRARLAIEAAYHRPPSFISTMLKLSANTAQWLVTLVCGPRLLRNVWQGLSSLKTCDSANSIISLEEPSFSANSEDFRTISKTRLWENSAGQSSNNCELLNRTKSLNFLQINTNNRCDNKLKLTNSCSYSKFEKSVLFGSFNFGKLKTEVENSNVEKLEERPDVEDFLTEFCEVLETTDVKDTNFFISTLLTAVLTHHLGWVATCISSESDTFNSFKEPYNALWSQLTDIYGAVGFPVKTAQTIISGSKNKSDVINKILNCLTYFIRFNQIERKTVERTEVDVENKKSESILIQADCIPKESYKKYEDHVRELLVHSHSNAGSSYERECQPFEGEWVPTEAIKHVSIVTKNNEIKILNNKDKQSNTKGLSKVKTLTNLSTLCKDEVVKATELKKNNKEIILPNSFIKKSTKFCNLDEATKFDLDLNENFAEKSDSSVIFVLGDNEKLVNLKKELNLIELPKNDNFKDTSQLKRRNSFHNIYLSEKHSENYQSFKLRKTSVSTLSDTSKLSKLDKENSEKTTISNFDFLKNKNVVDPFREEFVSGDSYVRLKPSASYVSLCTTSTKTKKQSSEKEVYIKKLARCQSEPPEDRPKSNQQKFKYSGVKFNLQQYPQVVRNYMKSKNLELESLAFEDKIGTQFSTVENNIKLDLSGFESEEEFFEVLQTPSNATEELSELHDPNISPTRELLPKIAEITEKIENKNEKNDCDLEESILTAKNCLNFIEKPHESKLKDVQISCRSDGTSLEVRPSTEENKIKTIEKPKLKTTKSSFVLCQQDSFENQESTGINKGHINDLGSLEESLPNNSVNQKITSTNAIKSNWVLGRADSLDDNQQQNNFLSPKIDWSEKEANYVESKKLRKEHNVNNIVIPMKIVELPMPKSVISEASHPHPLLHYSASVLKGLVDTYIPDMVLQGTTSPNKVWNSALKSNLAMNSLLDHPVEESLAILANTDTWEVQVISSHTYVIDQNTTGVRVGMSQLVSNMLESLLQMWKAHIPPQHCLVHIEQKLQELCVLSKALAQLLLSSEFCSMEMLTSTLHLEVNDVPLLMAVASTHTPQVTEKYGLSFQ